MFAESLKRLRFDPVRGFLKGFIDMVFRHEGRYYLIDWKSNFLGARKEDYHRDRLLTAMTSMITSFSITFMFWRFTATCFSDSPVTTIAPISGGVYSLFLRG